MSMSRPLARIVGKRRWQTSPGEFVKFGQRGQLAIRSRFAKIGGRYRSSVEIRKSGRTARRRARRGRRLLPPSIGGRVRHHAVLDAFVRPFGRAGRPRRSGFEMVEWIDPGLSRCATEFLASTPRADGEEANRAGCGPGLALAQ